MAQRLVYGIDVGTTKVVAIAGRVDDRRGLAEVLSIGEAPSYGLRRGIVVDREGARESISEAIEACGVRGGPVSVGIASGHISSSNTEVTLLNRSRNRAVTERFVRRIKAEAGESTLGEDERVIHVVPRSFTLDGSEGVKQPVGLAARRVTMRAHVVNASVSSIQNLLQAVDDCGVQVSQVVLEPLASAESVLLDEDREMGTALIDIGGGTTDIATFSRGALTHTAVIPLGGQSLSADLAYGFKVPFDTAEALKLRYGNVLSDTVDSVAAVRLKDRHYNASFMSQILEYRAREILEFADDSITEARLRGRLPGGVVLTGGGSLLEGMEELAEDILGMQVKLAVPRRIRRTKANIKPIQKPQYATAVGLLYFSARDNDSKAKSKGASDLSFGSIVAAVKGWFQGG